MAFALLVAAALPQTPVVAPSGVSGAQVRAMAEATVRIVEMERIRFITDKMGHVPDILPTESRPMMWYQLKVTPSKIFVEFL